MLDLINSLFSGNAVWFSVPALLGTGFFIIKIVLLSLGASGFDTDHAVDVHDAGAGDHHSDSAAAFKLLSLQAVLAFAMGFGWGGLAALRGMEWTLPASFLTAIGTGVGMMWLLGMILRSMFELQASGNVSIRTALGSQGTIYVAVPRDGQGWGQVRLVVDGKDRIFNAVTQGDELPSQTRVSVVGINDDNTLTVARV